MGLFRRKPEVDAELESRVDRLQSECRQARLHCQLLPDGADKQNRLKDLEVAEQAVAEARAEGDKTARIRAALKAEAELCLTKSVPLLVPTANRLREKLYRLDSKRREEAWGKYLDRLTKDDDALDEQAEQAVRFRLKSLTYESTEAAERYKRLVKERSSAIRIILAFSFVIDLLQLAGYGVAALLEYQTQQVFLRRHYLESGEEDRLLLCRDETASVCLALRRWIRRLSDGDASRQGRHCRMCFYCPSCEHAAFEAERRPWARSA